MHGPDDIDRYVTYVVRYPTGKFVPLTQIRFAARIGSAEGQQFIQQTLDLGGTVTAAGRDEPLVASDLPDARDLPGVASVVAIDLADNVFLDDEALANLGELASLERLDLHGTSVTQKVLTTLRELKRLRALNVSGLKITDAIGAMLPASLEELDVSHTAVGDFLLYDLKNLKSLERLVVTGTKITDKGVEALRKSMPDCEVIR